MPSDSPATRLIVRLYHEENNSSACSNHLLLMLSRGFWVVAGREVRKEHIIHCMIYKKNKAAPASQLMALLPQNGLTFKIRAFSNAGIDFAGPLLTVQTQEKKVFVSLYMFIIYGSSFGDDVWVGYNSIFKCVLQNGQWKGITYGSYHR